MAVNYETLFPSFRFVAVPLQGQPFGTNDDPDRVFAIYDKAAGSRVIYERAAIAG